MQDWTTYLPKTGSKINLPLLPDGSLALDNNIEQNGLGANSLFGSFTAIIGIGQAMPGGGFIRQDAVNRRWIINDGVTDRILIGYQENGF